MKRTNGLGNAGQVPEEMVVSVDGYAKTEVQAEVVMGNLWPHDIYEAHMKKKIPKGRLQTMTIGGVTYKGIVLDSSFGEPIGVIRLRHTVTQGVVRKHRLSPADCPREQSDEMYDSVQKKLKVSVAHKKGDGQETGAIISFGGGKRTEDALDAIDDLWAPPRSSGTSSTEPSTKTQPRRDGCHRRFRLR